MKEINKNIKWIALIFAIVLAYLSLIFIFFPITNFFGFILTLKSKLIYSIIMGLFLYANILNILNK